MPLVDIELSIDGSDLPCDVRAFLREAYLRVGRFVTNSPIRVTGFAPSSFETVYQSLRAIAEPQLAPGNSFCEWGSGFGVAASLAAMLKFRAYGIEMREISSMRRNGWQMTLAYPWTSFTVASSLLGVEPLPMRPATMTTLGFLGYSRTQTAHTANWGSIRMSSI